MGFKVFVSHSKADAERLRPLTETAKPWDVDLYLYENDVGPGQYVVDKVQDAIKASDFVFVFISRRNQYSAYVHQEIGYAEGQGVPVVPFVEAGIEPKNLGMLEGREYIPFDPDNPEAYLEKTREFLKKNEDIIGTVIAVVFIAVIAAIVVILLAASLGGKTPPDTS